MRGTLLYVVEVIMKKLKYYLCDLDGGCPFISTNYNQYITCRHCVYRVILPSTINNLHACVLSSGLFRSSGSGDYVAYCSTYNVITVTNVEEF